MMATAWWMPKGMSEDLELQENINKQTEREKVRSIRIARQRGFKIVYQCGEPYIKCKLCPRAYDSLQDAAKCHEPYLMNLVPIKERSAIT